MSAPPPANYHSLVRGEVFHLVPAGGRLLDFGGGDGATAAALKRRDPAALVGVADRVPPAPGNLLDFAFQGDLADPATLDRLAAVHGPFDTILCLDVLEHFADPWAVVARLHAMLAPGGCLVASVPNVRFYGVSLPLLLRGDWRYTDAGVLDRTHLRFFGKVQAIELLTGSGLVLEAIESPIPRARRLQLANLLSLGLLRGLLCQQFLLRVRRVGPISA